MEHFPKGRESEHAARRRVLAFVAGVAIAIVGVCAALALAFALPSTRALVVRAIASTYLSLKGFHLEHADVTMNDGVFDARDIVVTDGSRPFFDTAELRITYGEYGRALGISSIRVVQPRVFIHRAADGSYDVARLAGGGGTSNSTSRGSPFRAKVDLVAGSVYVVSDAAPTARVVELRDVAFAANVDQGGRSSGKASLSFGGSTSPSGVTAVFEQNDIARIARAHLVVHGAPLGPLVDVPVSSSAFVVERGVADMKLDAYAVGWDPSTGPQWRFISAGSVHDGALRTLPLAKPITGVAGRFSVFDGTLEFEGLRGSTGGVPLAAAGSVELFPDLLLGLRARADGPLEGVRQLLPFSSKLPLAGKVAIGVAIDGPPANPHANIELKGLRRVRYGGVPIDGLGLSAYYHDGHVALQSMTARYDGSTIGGDGDIDLTAAPVTGQFVVVARAPSREIPFVADIDTRGTTSALVAFDGPLLRLSGSGFAATTGGEQRMRAQVAAGPDGLAFSSRLEDRAGGELVALGELGHDVASPAAIDIYATRYHARLNGHAVAPVGFTTHPIGLPNAAATVNGYAVMRGAESMPGAAVRMSADSLKIAGTSLGRVAVDAYGQSGALRIDRLAIDGPGIHAASAGVVRLAPEKANGIGVAAALQGRAHGDLGRIGGNNAAHGSVDGAFSAIAHGSTWIADVTATSPDRSVEVMGVPAESVRALFGGEGDRFVVYGAGADVADGHVDVQGTVPGRERGSLTVAVRGIDLAHQHAIALPIASGAVVAIGVVGGTANAPVASGDAAVANSDYAGMPLDADTGLTYSSGSLDVRAARVVGAGSVAEMNGRINGLNSRAPQVSMEASLPAADLGVLTGAFAPSSSLGGIGTGRFRASGALSDPTVIGDFDVGAGAVRGVGFTDLHAGIDATRGSVAVNDGAVTFGSSRIALSGSFSGSGTALHASSAHVDLNDFNDFFNGKDVLEGHGALDVAISNVIGDNDASGSFSLADARVSGVPLGVVEGRVSRAGGDLAIAMTQNSAVSTSKLAVLLPPQSGRLPVVAVRGDVQRLDIGALAPFVGLEDDRLRGIAHGAFSGSASSGDVRGGLTFGVSDASVRGVAIQEASGGVAVAHRAVAVHDLRVAIDGASATVNGSVDQHRAIRAHADVAVTDLSKLAAFAPHPMPVSGSATASIDANGGLYQPDLRVRMSASRGQVRHVRFDSVGAVAMFERGMLTTSGSVQLSKGRGTVSFGGSVPIQTKPFRIGPNDKTIAFDARLDRIGIGALDSLFAGSVAAGGRADGDLRVRGTAGKPTVAGSLQLRNVSVSSKFDRVPLTGLGADVDFSNDSIVLKALHAAVGSGTVDARGSAHIVPATAIRRYASLQYAFGTQLHGAQVDVPDVLTGTVDAQLGITKSGPVPYLYGGMQFSHTTIPFTTIVALASNHTAASGNSAEVPGLPPVRPHHIVVYGGSVFGDDLDHVERPTPPPATPSAIAVVPSSVGLNVRVIAGQDVGVSGILNVTGKGEVDVGGTTSAPTLDGVLTAVRGQAGFLNTNFELVDGRVMFNKRRGLLPDVSADAITHTEDADITISTYGRVDNLHTDMTSDPPMDRGAIVATLLHVPQINSALASSHGEEQYALGVSPGNLVSGAIAGQILSALNIGLEQVFNLEEVDFGLDPFGRPTLEVRKQVSPRAYTLYRTTFSVPPAQALGIAYQVRRALQVELTQSQTTPGILGTYALPQTSLLVKLTFH
ncbi:MAG TPA: translocation/assembly module TamB domain-containing protein [Candidatus Eremiobacteraceae bacterium]|nr:translocation/assembly module TamB domain-containing protein [Candidatus Eremiobacteraceae bacterium]